ncbi:MAG: MFS transporter [Candidatus Velthaea sp.]
MTTLVSYGTTQYLFGVLLEPVSREFGWSKTAIGSAYAGTVLVSGFAGLALGRALDRIGARLLLSLGSVVSGVALLLLSHVQTLAEFDALWTFGLGAGAALTYYPVTFTVVANWFAARRIHALSVLTFMGAFASTIFYPLAGWLVHALGWREALVALALLQFGVALPLHAFVVRRHPEDMGLRPDGAPTGEPPGPASGISFRDALHDRGFWLLSAGMSLAYFSTTTILLEHVAYLIGRGFAPTLVATLAGLFGIAYLPGRSLVVWLNRRMPLTAQLACAFALAALGIVLLSAARNAAWIVAYVAVFGAAYGALSPLRGAVIAERFGRRAYGAIFAAQGVPVGILSAAGPVAGGRLIDVFGYGAAFAVCIAALAGAAFIVLFAASPARFSSDASSSLTQA